MGQVLASVAVLVHARVALDVVEVWAIDLGIKLG